jgi:tRNA(Ile)-lysidine synthase
VTLDEESVRLSPMRVTHTDEIGSELKKRECVLASVPSTVYWARTGQQIHVQHMTRCEAEQGGSRSTQRVLFDADRYSEPLIIRSWQAGDRFSPQGMKGRNKKLQDFFTDGKIARYQRDMIPLLVAPEGILWVVGMRQDERFVVSSGTSRCLVVSVSSRVSKKG